MTSERVDTALSMCLENEGQTYFSLRLNLKFPQPQRRSVGFTRGESEIHESHCALSHLNCSNTWRRARTTGLKSFLLRSAHSL